MTSGVKVEKYVEVILVAAGRLSKISIEFNEPGIFRKIAV